MFVRDHRWMHSDRNLTCVTILLSNSEKFHDVTQAPSDCDIARSDVANALVVHISGYDFHPEGDARNDCGLGACVKAFNIGGWVTLGIPQTLSFSEGICVISTLICHLRQDVVRRAVKDSHHPRHRLASKAFPQRSNQRNAASDGRLKQQINPVGICKFEQFCSMICEEFFISRDHRLSGR